MAAAALCCFGTRSTSVKCENSVMEKTKPSKPVTRMCKFISRLGKLVKKSSPSHPAIKVSCCIENTTAKISADISEPIPIALAPQNLLLTIPTSNPLPIYGESPLPSPLSPRASSYPPTPDYVKFPGLWKCPDESSLVFFPADSVDAAPEVRDWAIDYADLEIGAVYQKNSTGEICRGRWHGNVLVYRHLDLESVDQFMNDVENFSKIRHENLLLFMGATVEKSDELSIVVLPPKQQESLHQLLSSPRRLNKLPHTLKWSIAQQIAQAVSYLHAKDVVVGPALHSGNVFVESKIKLSLLDFGFGPDVFSRHSSRNYLSSYLAPELLPYLDPNNYAATTADLKLHADESTDSYAFGSLLYEVFTEQKPFKNYKPAEIIELIRSGNVANILERPEIPATIRKIIAQCWSFDAHRRPNFAEILDSALQRKTLLLTRHSSQPDKLDVMGVSLSRSFS